LTEEVGTVLKDVGYERLISLLSELFLKIAWKMRTWKRNPRYSEHAVYGGRGDIILRRDACIVDNFGPELIVCHKNKP
jgi:hypothetical protein